MTWIQTHTGIAVDLDRPQVEQIALWDIAWALGHLCRYTGHTDIFYSVAEHSLHVAEIVARTNPELEEPALHHDDEEAYIGDVSSPLKAYLRQLGLDWRMVSGPFKHVIGVAFGLILDPEDPVVTHADRIALMTERRDFMLPPIRQWGPELEAIRPDSRKLVPLGNPVKAATSWYHRAVMLQRAALSAREQPEST